MFTLFKSLLIYFIPIFIISPIIDTFFGELDKTKGDIRILLEILIHTFVLIILSKYFESFISKKIEVDKNILHIVRGIILVGLQKNLIDKLNYITYKNPIRSIKFF